MELIVIEVAPQLIACFAGLIAIVLLALNALMDGRDVRLIEQGIKGMQARGKQLKANYGIELRVPKDFRDYWVNYRKH